MIEFIDDEKEKASICNKILRALPDWFGIEQAIVDYVDAVKDMPMFVSLLEGEVVGFLSLKPQTEHAAEIYVMGVMQEFHHKGIGGELVKHSETYLRDKGYSFFTVKTLSSTRESMEYGKTRLFYLSLGFFPIEEFPDLWGKENPCLFLVKPI